MAAQAQASEHAWPREPCPIRRVHTAATHQSRHTLLLLPQPPRRDTTPQPATSHPSASTPHPPPATSHPLASPPHFVWPAASLRTPQPSSYRGPQVGAARALKEPFSEALFGRRRGGREEPFIAASTQEFAAPVPLRGRHHVEAGSGARRVRRSTRPQGLLDARRND